MKGAGFVLVGGKSSRMGRDKALLPYGSTTLVEHVAAEVQAAAGSVTLVGDAERYRALQYPILADDHPGFGPVGGIYTALRASPADWNLVVACDMPGLTAPFLQSLLAAAEVSGADCLVPLSPSGRLEPLCAAYHRRGRPVLAEAIRGGVHKLAEALAGLRVAHWPVSQAAWFENVNTPADWEALQRRHA